MDAEETIVRRKVGRDPREVGQVGTGEEDSGTKGKASPPAPGRGSSWETLDLDEELWGLWETLSDPVLSEIAQNLRIQEELWRTIRSSCEQLELLVELTMRLMSTFLRMGESKGSGSTPTSRE